MYVYLYVYAYVYVYVYVYMHVYVNVYWESQLIDRLFENNTDKQLTCIWMTWEACVYVCVCVCVCVY